MLKQLIFVTASLAAISGIVLADPVPYVGLSTGIVNNAAQEKDTSAAKFFLPSSRNVPVKLFAGYGGAINQNLYLAGEVEVGTTAATLNDAKFLRVSRTYGASVLPGVMLNDDTVLFTRLGLLKTRFSKERFGGDTLPSFSTLGGEIGLGLQANVAPNFAIRGEYDYVAYRKEAKSLQTVFKTPQADQFMVSAIYKFN